MTEPKVASKVSYKKKGKGYEREIITNVEMDFKALVQDTVDSLGAIKAHRESIISINTDIKKMKDIYNKAFDILKELHKIDSNLELPEHVEL